MSRAKFPAGEVAKAARYMMASIEKDREDAKAKAIAAQKTAYKWDWFALWWLPVDRPDADALRRAERSREWGEAKALYYKQYNVCKTLLLMAVSLHPSAAIEMTTEDFRMIAGAYPDHAAHVSGEPV